MSSEKKNMASASDLPSAKPELTNNSQINSNSNHASTSGNSIALHEIPNNSQAKVNFPSTTRLTSFLAPRDLTLGANSVKADRPKKIYTPNLNAQRKKKEDEPTVAQKNAKGPRNKHKGKGHERGNKHKSNLIQSTGVFSEGLADSYKRKSRSGYDFAEENKEVNYKNCPVALPMTKEGKLFKENVDVKINPETKIKLELEEEGNLELMDDVDIKPIDKVKFKVDKEFEKKHVLNVSQSLENQTNGYVIISFPNVLPGAPNETEEDQPRTNKNAPPQIETNKAKTETQPLLDNLNEGLLGKLQILKSGAARLCLGNNNFAVELGPQVFFREEVVAVKLEDERQSGELINLGPVHTNLFCTPDWESLA